MIRYSAINKILNQSRYIINHKKPVTQIPSKNPPKYIYETKYHPAANPGIDMGYPDHHHISPFEELGSNKYEQFRFKYAGEWFEGDFVPKLIWLASPFLIFLVLCQYGADNKKLNYPNTHNMKQLDSIYFVQYNPYSNDR